MGMFDTVIIENDPERLFVTNEGVSCTFENIGDFQTKDLGCSLDKYIIRDYQLLRSQYDWETKEDEPYKPWPHTGQMEIHTTNDMAEPIYLKGTLTKEGVYWGKHRKVGDIFRSKQNLWISFICWLKDGKIKDVVMRCETREALIARKCADDFYGIKHEVITKEEWEKLDE